MYTCDFGYVLKLSSVMVYTEPVRSLAAACPFRDVGLLHNLYVVGVGVLVVVAVDIVHRRLAVIFAGISNGV